MPHVIVGVAERSPADAAGIAAGDILLALDGHEIIDWMDYQALSAQKRVTLSIMRGGRRIDIRIDKGEYQPIGLSFDSQLMSPVRMCVNKCLFCFVDQQPTDIRESLRVKDDDWRLSLMTGTYVTLTNVNRRELQRIIDLRASPLYVSVHSTDEGLRAKLLGRTRGDGILDKLKLLAGAGICFHAQAVLCPGLNDGAALMKTVEDLAGLAPSCLSLALVPVGLTAHREGLAPLRGYDAPGARAVLAAASEWQDRFFLRLGTRFVYAADEFYLLSGIDPPHFNAYDNFPQIENGIGMMRLLEAEFTEACGMDDLSGTVPGRRIIATGFAAAAFMEKLVKACRVPGVEVDVIAVKNKYYGETVTVAGLIAGSDLINATRNLCADEILITERMLRAGGDEFLDGVTLDEARAAISRPIIPVGRHGEELLRSIMGIRSSQGA
jgi:putative radical SAM enzyme (TIGR03279 family)